MVSPIDSQDFESYVPVYDVVPERWEDARPFLVEQLRKITNAVNIREIGWYLDEELLSGKSFIPSSPGTGAGQVGGNYRTILRKVIDTGMLVAGANAPILHGIAFDANFTLIDLWVAGTNSTALTARVISGDNVVMTATDIQITSPQAFDRSYAIVEYIEEQ